MGKRAIGATLFVVGLMSVTATAAFFQQAGSGMVGFWRLEENASPSMDSSGNGNTSSAWPAGISFLAGPANTPAALGANSAGCLSFDGTTGFVSIPSTPALTITGDITIALWIYKNVEAGDWVRLVGKGASAVRTFGVWEEAGAGTRILFQMYNGSGGSVLDVFSTGNIPLTAWTHVTCRLSGNNATIFINGASSGSGTRSGTPGSSADPVTLGFAGFHTYWNGRMDDVRIYNRALTDPEIAAIAAGGQGPAAPTGLTAAAGNSQVQLNWSGSAMVYNVKRSTTAGGPYTTLMSNVATNSFTDSTVTNGTTYYYVVSGVTYGEGPNSNEASATPLPVTALPNAGLVTTESGGTATFNVTFNSPAPALTGSRVTVTSNNLLEGVVSTTYAGRVLTAGGFYVDVAPGLSPVIPVTVTGVDDAVADGNQPYSVSVTASNFPTSIPNVNLTNNDNDIPGITFSRTSGLVTTEGGGTDSFSVSLNTQPTGTVTLTLSSSNPLEATVAPTTIQFNSGNWNAGIPVVVTGVDDTLLDFTQPFTILSQPLSAPSDPGYAGMIPPNVSGQNLDDEVIPDAPHAWGGGGCGLLGAEIALLFLLRRLRARKA